MKLKQNIFAILEPIKDQKEQTISCIQYTFCFLLSISYLYVVSLTLTVECFLSFIRSKHKTTRSEEKHYLISHPTSKSNTYYVKQRDLPSCFCVLTKVLMSVSVVWVQRESAYRSDCSSGLFSRKEFFSPLPPAWKYCLIVSKAASRTAHCFGVRFFSTSCKMEFRKNYQLLFQ